jgi:hypothetical protein
VVASMDEFRHIQQGAPVLSTFEPFLQKVGVNLARLVAPIETSIGIEANLLAGVVNGLADSGRSRFQPRSPIR